MLLKDQGHATRVLTAWVLCLACLALTVAGLAGCAKGSGDDSAPAAATAPAAEGDADSEAAFAGYLVDVAEVNSWQESGLTAHQMTATFRNMTGEAVEAWGFTLPLGMEVEVADHWNCNVDVTSEALSFSPADYNARVDAKGSVGDIGFIFKAKVDVDLAGTYVVDAETHVATRLSDEERTALLKSLQGALAQSGSELGVGEKGAGSVQKAGTGLFADHGRLAVSGTDLVDQDGKPFQLRGVSTHGIAWYPEYVNKGAFQTLRDDWGANLVRLAMYTDESGGYCTDGDKQQLEATIDRGVRVATDLDMYVIIDWHILSDQTPAKYQDQAKSFFQRMSAKYAGNGNVLYEICNEPNGATSWAEVKAYAEEIIPVIQANDPDAVIIVGTPTWSQDVGQAAANPVDARGNIMYSLHFYAATHKDDLRNKLVAAHDVGLPIFISEFSICDASGNGGIDYDSAAAWRDLIEKYNLSYAGWSLSNKAESSALLNPGVTATDGGWDDSELSETGLWLKTLISAS